MANFETVKLLAKEVPFLLEDVCEFVFTCIVSYIRTIRAILAKKKANRKFYRTATSKIYSFYSAAMVSPSYKFGSMSLFVRSCARYDVKACVVLTQFCSVCL